ncbi:MAG: hypothetical protein AB1813_10095 [Verrucomicrobiota bacterium]
MTTIPFRIFCAFICASLISVVAAQTNAGDQSLYARWPNGPSADPAFFPIAVWLQHPKNALRFKAAGINLYVGLWRGPTEEQLSALQSAGMRVICSQNAVGLANKNNPIIAGWMHGDEPDNAQSLGSGKGYGPPILPSKIRADYERMRTNDPSRPVFLNLGQGVAWDNYIGRGTRRNHPEDYLEYVKGCDIASFDIYPAVHDHKEIAGKLEVVPYGVRRLVQWTGGVKPVWNCIECTRISNEQTKPTPAQVRSEVWMSLIHGSRGIIYFVHQFKPEFREAALLDDPEMLAAITTLNRQIHALAPVLNSPTISDAVEVQSSDPAVPVAALVKQHEGAVYLFAVTLRAQPAKATFTLRRLEDQPETIAEALDESRKIPVRNGIFTDEFTGYGVHLYRIGLR